MNTIMMILGFGAAGVFARYELQNFVAQRWPENTHVATFLVNILGSFAMGAVYVLSLEKAQISDEMRAAIMIGFLGGMTTFSSYALDSIRLLESGNMARTLLYVSLSPALSILCCFFGLVAARRFG